MFNFKFKFTVSLSTAGGPGEAAPTKSPQVPPLRASSRKSCEPLASSQAAAQWLPSLGLDRRRRSPGHVRSPAVPWAHRLREVVDGCTLLAASFSAKAVARGAIGGRGAEEEARILSTPQHYSNQPTHSKRSLCAPVYLLASVSFEKMPPPVAVAVAPATDGPPCAITFEQMASYAAVESAPLPATSAARLCRAALKPAKSIVRAGRGTSSGSGTYFVSLLR